MLLRRSDLPPTVRILCSRDTTLALDFAINGCDFVRYGENGKIVDFMVMVRPLRAAEALAQRMGERFEQIKADAIAAVK